MYSWETGGVTVILRFEAPSISQITLTLALSHEYVGEGTKEGFVAVALAV
jgi:hypothetical protein